MLSALATGHKIGLAVVTGVFIVFALASSFVLPRLRPDFPGRRVGLFVGLTAVLTAGMLAAVIALAGEPKEKREAVAETTATTTGTTGATTAGTGTTATGTTGATTAGTGTTATGTAGTTTTAPVGDAAAGKELFAAEGCGSCHTFAPAGATGTVGPDLDNLAADAQKAGRGSVQQYAAESINDPNAYVVPGYPSGVMPQFDLSRKQVDDLVAFLTQ